MSTTITSRARVPTPKQLSSVNVKRDEFETFWHILITYCQQDAGYIDFFEGGAYEQWEPLSQNPTRGITVKLDRDEAANDQEMWKGIKYLKGTYMGRVYARTDKDGKSIPFDQQAERTAEHLAEKQWGPDAEQDGAPGQGESERTRNF